MLEVLLGLLPNIFSSLNTIAQSIANERIAALNAKTDQERIAAEERINVLQSQRDVLIAESAVSKLNIYIRALIAIGPALYLTKIFIWDKVLQQLTGGSTDPLDPNLWQVVMVVLGFYFLAEASITVSRIIKA